MRAGIFPLSSYAQLPEVARMGWLLGRCQQQGCRRDFAAAALLIDCAARSPQFTLAAGTSVLGAGRRSTGLMAVRHLLTLFKSRKWPSFWRGHSVGLVRAMCSWNADDVIRVGRRLAAGGRRRRTQRLLDELQSLRGIGTYLSMGMLRIIMAAMSAGPMRGAGAAAACMSDHVERLTEVLPFRDAQGFLLANGVSVARSWDASFLAYLFCEVAKVLRYASVLAPFSQYRCSRSLLEADLASARTKDWLQHLEAALANLPVVVRCPTEIVDTSRMLGLPQHSMVQVQALSVYKHLCGKRSADR